MKGIAPHARKQGARRFIWRCGSFFGVRLIVYPLQGSEAVAVCCVALSCAGGVLCSWSAQALRLGGCTACNSCTPCTACTLSGSARSAALRRAPCSSIIRGRGGYICASVMQFESAHTTQKTNKKRLAHSQPRTIKKAVKKPPQIPQYKKQKALIITQAIIISKHFVNTFNPSQPFSTD